MADDKTTKMPEQPVTDTGLGKETPPEPEKTPTPSEAEKKTEQQAKSPQVSVYDFAEIMKGKKAEERAATSGGEKPAPAKTEKSEKQPEAPKKAEGKREKPPKEKPANTAATWYKPLPLRRNSSFRRSLLAVARKKRIYQAE